MSTSSILQLSDSLCRDVRRCEENAEGIFRFIESMSPHFSTSPCLHTPTLRTNKMRHEDCTEYRSSLLTMVTSSCLNRPSSAFLSVSTGVIQPFFRRQAPCSKTPQTRRRPRPSRHYYCLHHHHHRQPTSAPPYITTLMSTTLPLTIQNYKSNSIVDVNKSSNDDDDDDATEHFDFIRQSPSPSSSSSPEQQKNDQISQDPSSTSSAKIKADPNEALTELPPLVPTPQSMTTTPDITSQPSNSANNLNNNPITTSTNSQLDNPHIPSDQLSSPTGTAKSPTVRVLLASPGYGRVVFERARRETLRALSESDIFNMIRLPSRRETITMAGEMAFVIAVLLLLRAGVSSVLRWVHARLSSASGQDRRSTVPYEASIFECMQRPLEFLSVFTVGTALAEVVSRPLAATGLLRQIRSVRELGVIIAATWFLLRWIDRIRSRFAADKRIDKSQVDATARFATVATFVVSLLISLDTMGVNVQAVLAFGGIGGVAIGFAGREIISNFFGGFMIYVTRPFTVGEWIRCIEEAQLNGTVEDIGWYLTRVRTWDKRPLYIPNSRFSTLIVENGSRMDNRRIVHTLHLRLEDVPVVKKIVTEMGQVLMQHPGLDPKQHRMVYVDSFDDYSIRVWFSCYTKSVFLYDFRDIQQQLLLSFYDIIRSSGAQLASRNTRDMRPGANTDQYGPFGPYASVPVARVDGIPDDDDELAAAKHIDNIPYSMVDHLHDPLDQTKLMERPHPVSSSPGAGVASPAAASPSSSTDSNSSSVESGANKEFMTSDAAITAVVGALAAARRIASRRQASKSPSASNSASTTSAGAPVSSVPGSLPKNKGDVGNNDASIPKTSSATPPSASGFGGGDTGSGEYNGSGGVKHGAGVDGVGVGTTSSNEPPVLATTNTYSQGQMKISKAPSQSTPGQRSENVVSNDGPASSGEGTKIKGVATPAGSGGGGGQMKISGDINKDKEDGDKEAGVPGAASGGPSSAPTVAAAPSSSAGANSGAASGLPGDGTIGGATVERSGQMKISAAKPIRNVSGNNSSSSSSSSSDTSGGDSNSVGNSGAGNSGVSGITSNDGMT